MMPCDGRQSQSQLACRSSLHGCYKKADSADIKTVRAGNGEGKEDSITMIVRSTAVTSAVIDNRRRNDLVSRCGPLRDRATQRLFYQGPGVFRNGVLFVFVTPPHQHRKDFTTKSTHSKVWLLKYIKRLSKSSCLRAISV